MKNAIVRCDSHLKLGNRGRAKKKEERSVKKGVVKNVVKMGDVKEAKKTGHLRH
jgi:hypothetical protein